MGSYISFIEKEKKSWKSHSLIYDEAYRIECDKLIKEFYINTKLHLCFKERTYNEVSYNHWFVSNGEIHLEFGSDKDDIYNAITNINRYPKGKYAIHSSYEMNDEIENRMLHVSGLKNYSLCLRNCEHVANYVLNGSWVSSQMKDGCDLHSKFIDDLRKDNKDKLTQTFPGASILDNNKDVEKIEKVYNFVDSTFTYKRFDYYLDNASDSHIILVLGVSGAGKSNLVNVLFNQKIVKSKKNLHSVSKDIVFLKGSGNMVNYNLYEERKNIILVDTLGLCDSQTTSEEALEMNKSRISSNMNEVSQVIIVATANRLSLDCSDNIKKIMKWLKYDKYYSNFKFVITNCQDTEEQDKEELKSQLIGILNLIPEKEKTFMNGRKLQNYYPIECVDFSTGKSPEEEEIKMSYKRLKDLITYIPKNNVVIAKNSNSKSTCNIL